MFPNKKLIYLCGANDGRYANTEGYHRAERRVQWRTARSSRYGRAGGRSRNVSRWCNVKLLGWEIGFLLFCNVIWTSLVAPRAVDWTWPEQLIWNWAFMLAWCLAWAWGAKYADLWFACGGVEIGLGLGPSIMQMKEITACLLPSHSYKVTALFVGILSSIIRPNPKISFK